MDSFKALLCFMRSSTDCENRRFDVLTSLPPEMVIKILRMLDPTSLLSCALVSKSWLSYVHGDPQLRSRIRQHLRHAQRQRRAKPLNIRVRALREGHQGVPFLASNDNFQMKTIHSKAAMLGWAEFLVYP
ncbi:probable E3 ubiquitin ligase complex SCF subunit sconB [Ischnura elegans]|uniref:probable E3 ubiquitin ligase complex SCF subunit sconB n=1 Tax=Ischnura elegans TaxID=197161 RepID=UPI001ED881BD|nr:probable E3 ubiquitin ligase complex SCF subunit sconB [Ischnura elegans]